LFYRLERVPIRAVAFSRVPTEVEQVNFNIADLFESLADAIGERDALVCGSQRLTFRALDERANRLAHYLESRGVGAGDHVGMYLFNCAEFLEGMLAAFKLRAVPININYRYVADELRYMLDNADLAALIYQREFAPVVREVAGEFPLLRVLIHVEDDSRADLGTLETTTFEQAVVAGRPERGFPSRSDDDLYIIYTGGTTGMPKGVMWRHGDVFFAGLQGGNPGGTPISKPEELAELARQKNPAMVTMPVAPFIHGAAQWAALIGMFGGGKVVVQPGRSMNPALIWELVARERVNLMTIVGDAMARPLASELAKQPGRYDTSSLIVIGSAGAVFSESVKDELKKHLSNVFFIDSFGSTESGHTGSMTATRSVSGSGHPRFQMTENVTVLDDAHRKVVPGSGVMGMLARKGRLPVGYYKDEKKTKDTFVEVDGERWVIPGDMATLDADGMITVFGRGAVCINSGGEKIFPEEVEEVLKAHPDVEDAIVVGVPDERWGQRVAAVVQPRTGREPDDASIDAYCRKHIAGYKVPKDIYRVGRVQRQPSGKPDYKWAKAVATGEIPQD
jgi:acyl-CoA synthetase (AMP-forming)/AMP-acid ligase II